ncbi:MAG: hypothetical protein V3W44_05100 [Dehalococcoidales bacterium]
MAHSPTPWRVEQVRKAPMVLSDKGVGVCRPYAYPGTERDDNARLIAAAPEMLEALNQTLEHCSFPYTDGAERTRAMIEAAIAKAIGAL